MSTHYWAKSILIALLVFSSSIRAADSDGQFVNPPVAGPSNNFAAPLAWYEGQVVDLQWNTTKDNYDLGLYQQGLDPPSGVQIHVINDWASGGAGYKHYQWTVSAYGADLSFSPVFFLWIEDDGFTSHYFNITPSSASSSAPTSSTQSSSVAPVTVVITTSSTQSSTSSVQSSTTSTPSSSTSTAPPQSSNTSTSTTSNESATSSNAQAAATSSTSQQGASSTAASESQSSQLAWKIGLGVGLGIGIPLVLIAGIWVGLKAVRQRRSSSRSQDSGVPLAKVSEANGDGAPTYGDTPHYPGIHEAPAKTDWSAYHEAPSTPRRRAELGS